jgi:hypothetical protein
LARKGVYGFRPSPSSTFWKKIPASRHSFERRRLSGALVVRYCTPRAGSAEQA